MYSFVFAFARVAMLWDLFIFLHVHVNHSFLWSYSISLCEDTTVNTSTHLLTGREAHVWFLIGGYSEFCTINILHKYFCENAFFL